MLLAQHPRSTRFIAAALLLAVLSAVYLVGNVRTVPQVTSQSRWPSGSAASGSRGNGDASSTPVTLPTPSDIDLAETEDNASTHDDDLPCHSLPGADDVLVVMRTGSTELKDKLPVHWDTTFRCYEHLVIYSDYAETFRGRRIHDVLADIPDEIRTAHEDFAHYRHVLRVGRENLDAAELSGNVSWESGPVGKNENAGWRLDKWKFLPMLNATLDMYPNMKWYVFVEPDTHLVWSNLLQWLSGLDPDTPSYYGSEVMIGDDVFAHGGSAFVLSQPALERGADRYRRHARDLWEFTAGHWAGDCVLGRTLRDAGVALTWSWPMFQGGNPYLMRWQDDKGPDRKLWCLPALSYHHISPTETLRLFHLEQDWLRSHPSPSDRGGKTSLAFWRHHSSSSSSADTILRHRDTFHLLIRPQISTERPDWSNFPEGEWTIVEDGDCRELCERNASCVQYASGPRGCATGLEMRLGQPHPGLRSGWMTDRVDAWVADIDSCSGRNSWTVVS